MLEPDPANILQAFQKIFKLMDQRCYNVVKVDGLTKNEAIILMFLSNHQNYDTASSITKVRGISKAHVAQSIDTLCKKGYLQTCCDLHDRRVQHLVIQEAAKPLVEKLNLERKTYLDTIFTGLSEQQKVDLAKIMQLVVKNSENLKEE